MNKKKTGIQYWVWPLLFFFCVPFFCFGRIANIRCNTHYHDCLCSLLLRAAFCYSGCPFAIHLPIVAHLKTRSKIGKGGSPPAGAWPDQQQRRNIRKTFSIRTILFILFYFLNASGEIWSKWPLPLHFFLSVNFMVFQWKMASELVYTFFMGTNSTNGKNRKRIISRMAGHMPAQYISPFKLKFFDCQNSTVVISKRCSVSCFDSVYILGISE